MLSAFKSFALSITSKLRFFQIQTLMIMERLKEKIEMKKKIEKSRILNSGALAVKSAHVEKGVNLTLSCPEKKCRKRAQPT